ncbi:DUF4389 domain-containing protein [Pseudohongiella sp.]|uniref:Lipase n=1 Tax=marine sediment metagenome TaxID=412755 RepID=A0A0F9WGV5_9ZZZZ|nr:DUF4389 domain-containing protein [Pseudohongiella sp.]HDZ09062.1 DUF4389 domain-containing protein [Pseudohongiella sp.]HEA62747.1 DUF4389 domain-containing protein [Pseudohongiella sp.]
MSDDYVENLKKPSAWLRVLFMAGFVLALYVAGVILLVLMLAQILFSLITGDDNVNLRRLGSSLTLYVSQILGFLTYNSEEKPFPFAQFPLANEDEVDDVTTADTADFASQPAAQQTPAAGSETAAESAAKVMAESAARRATRSTSKTPKAFTGKPVASDASTTQTTADIKTATPAEPGAEADTDTGPEMGVTDVVDKQAKDV